MKRYIILIMAVLLAFCAALPAFAEAGTEGADVTMLASGAAVSEGVGIDWLKNVIISLVIGLIVAFIAVAVMKSKLKSVHRENAASSYIKDNSFELNGKKDIFLYSTTDKTPRPKNNDDQR